MALALVLVLWLGPHVVTLVQYRIASSVPDSQWNASRVLAIVMVRNEERILGRLLDSLRSSNAVGLVFVCDTGSTDKTQQVAREAWPGSGWHYVGEFHDFETSRNLCMDAAKQWVGSRPIDWVLLPDADFTLHRQMPDRDLPAPAYHQNIMVIEQDQPGGPTNTLPLLVKASSFFQHCRYRVWTHEVLDCCEPDKGSGYYAGLYWVDHSDGSSRPHKLTRDIALLEEWIPLYNSKRNESGWRVDLYARGLYYLARAHEDSNHTERAAALYREHATVQPWTSYQFYGRYRMALMTLREYRAGDHKDWWPVERAFLDAYGAPDGYFRREVLWYLMWMFTELHEWNRCILYAAAGVSAPPVDYSRAPLFIESDKYDVALFRRGLDQCVYQSKTVAIGK